MAVSDYPGSAHTQRAMADINITPLVDVMLVLLIIFMVTAPLLTHRLDINLPQPGPERELPEPLQLQVRSDGRFAIDGQDVTAAELQQRLESAARLAPQPMVSIQADGDADYQGFTNALAITRDSGLQNIGLDQ